MIAAAHARVTLLAGWICILASTGPVRGVEVPAGPPEAQADIDLRVARLIEQLGADQFASRERAQGELEHVGLPAFDALHDAQDHEDIEIALRARYLLRVMPISWSRESDPPDVKNILRGYGDQHESERRSRMDQLAVLDDSRGLPALCRLARFETNNVLAKRAALLVMNQAEPDAKMAREQIIKVIRATVGVSRRPVAEWLRVFAQTLEDAPSTLGAWRRIAVAEQDLLAQFPEKTSADVVRDLLRWQVDLLRRLHQDDDARAMVRRVTSTLDKSGESLIEMSDWLGERAYWSEIEHLAKTYADDFEVHAMLLYLLAHAQQQLGQQAQGEQTAARAFELEKDRTDVHHAQAMELRNRGLFDWSEREYRHVIQKNSNDSPSTIAARTALSEMLHDIDKELAAAETLQGIVDELTKNANALRGFPWRDPGSIRSRMHFFYAQHFAATDRAKQRQHLEQAIESDPQDADVLIAMYRLAGADEAWQKKTRELIKAAADSFRSDIAESENESRRAADADQREELQREMATSCNQFAWLVGNTEGDYQEALRFSRRSVELSPNAPGLWDTLGRCYYAVGDLENAIKSQQRALKMEPHSGQMRRQLTMFQQALADRQRPATPRP